MRIRVYALVHGRASFLGTWLKLQIGNWGRSCESYAEKEGGEGKDKSLHDIESRKVDEGRRGRVVMSKGRRTHVLNIPRLEVEAGSQIWLSFA
jgi:hypothetical protein